LAKAFDSKYAGFDRRDLLPLAASQVVGGLGSRVGRWSFPEDSANIGQGLPILTNIGRLILGMRGEDEGQRQKR
jgi:hypothetical protein